MNKKLRIALVSVFTFLGVMFFSSPAGATVGGPSYVHSFTYNPANQSVYYIKNDMGGRGCPPELFKLSLETGVHTVVYSCEQAESSLSGEGSQDPYYIQSEFAKITDGFKNLIPINLKKNKIAVDVAFIRSEFYEPGSSEILRREFSAVVYQGEKKISSVGVTGCSLDQPFVFAGYEIPGFQKKMILLLSAKDNCFEGGYIGERLSVLGGLDSVNRIDAPNAYKGESALIPNEGTLVVYENDPAPKFDVVSTTTPPVSENHDSSRTTILIVGVTALILGFVTARIFTGRK